MNNLARLAAICSLCFILMACSTKPKKRYQVTTMQSISYSLLELADRKRQLGQFEPALLLYREAEEYAVTRNDKRVIGLAMLKRAAIHIELGQAEDATALIVEVEGMVEHEKVPLEDAVRFLKAKLAWFNKDAEQARTLLQGLQAHFAEDPERRIYYKFVTWSYWPSQYQLSEMAEALETLTLLKNERTLANIEIYSFALYQYLQQLEAQNSMQTPEVLSTALEHFSQLELSNKILDCFVLAQRFYERQQQLDKAAYYKTQGDKLRAALLQ